MIEEMNQGPVLVMLGVLFIGGLAVDQLGRITRLPRVTLLLLGLLSGHRLAGTLQSDDRASVRDESLKAHQNAEVRG